MTGRTKRLVVRRQTVVPGCPACRALPKFDGQVEREAPAHTHPVRRRRWLGIAARRTFT